MTLAVMADNSFKSLENRRGRKERRRQQLWEEIRQNQGSGGVIVIPPPPKAGPQMERQKLRVAAYCRVSTQEEEQMGSFDMQVHHFTKRIEGNPQWEMAGIYQDEGLSATTVHKRLGFQKMIEDAKAGKIDLILTKSISRFGRNIVDILGNLRTLSSLEPPVSVEFETEGITHTGDGKNSLLIILLSALAEMESQQKSEAIKAGIRWRMAEGVYKFSVQNTLGYYRDHFGRLVIEPTEARIVRYIYESCLEGATPAEIAEALTEQGIASPMHRNRWLPGTVRSILKNERYMGDALLQKEYTTDTVPFRQKRNHGEKAQYYVENSNPPIISREVFHAAQKLQESRITTTKREHNSILSGILRCPDCGSTFRRQLLRGTVYWMCSDKAAGATNCQSRRVRENAVFDTFCLMADKLASHRQDLLGTLIHQLEMMQNHGSESQEKIRQIDKQIADLSAQNLVVARLHTNGVLNATDFAAQLSVISNKINALRLDRKKALSEDEDDELIFTLKSLDDTLAGYVPGASFNRELFKETIQSITVMDNSKLTFHLIGGLAFTEQIPENVRCRTA